MSRKLLAFLLSELKTVRLVCRNPRCGAAVEMPVASLAQPHAGDYSCPACLVGSATHLS